MEIFQKLGIDWRLLIAQIINFLILLAILYRFLYRPLLKMLSDRTKKIEKGIKDAQDTQIKLAEITEKEKAVLGEAKKEAQNIIMQAEKTATEQKEDMKVKAKSEVELIVKEAKLQIASEKTNMINEAKKEVAELAIAIAEKILKEKIDRKKDQQIITKSLTNES